MKPVIIDGVVFLQMDDGRLIEAGVPEQGSLSLEEARANAQPAKDLSPQPVGDDVLEGLPEAKPDSATFDATNTISGMLGGQAKRGQTSRTNTEMGAALDAARPSGWGALNEFDIKNPGKEAKAWQAELSGKPVRKQLAAVAARQFEDE